MKIDQKELREWLKEELNKLSTYAPRRIPHELMDIQYKGSNAKYIGARDKNEHKN